MSKFCFWISNHENKKQYLDAVIIKGTNVKKKRKEEKSKRLIEPRIKSNAIEVFACWLYNLFS